jgi:hypothetical protein
MKRLSFSPVLFLLMALGSSCSEKSSPGSGTSARTSIQALPFLHLPAGWKYSPGYSGALPPGMQVYILDSIYAGRKTRAFCFAYDSKISSFEFKPTISATVKKPADFFREEPGLVYACINGGFFGGNQSYSLVKYNNIVKAVNIKTVTRSYNQAGVAYYPTRAAFGVNRSGVPDVSWIYHVGSDKNNIFSYPTPAPNGEGNPPEPVPTETFPAGAAPWEVVSAIGGAPLLIKNGITHISEKAELINIDNKIPRARSAIGFDANRIVLLLAVEGGESTDPSQTYVGVNLEELAALLTAFGCTNAINLDGGGSTSMVINNKLTVRPSDKGVERPVMSVLLIKKK